MQTDRDSLILEEPEKMCESCCNFDKEHIGMDGTALCKLTMTLAYAEDYGGNCMFYNVPKEQIIVPPCKVGDVIYHLYPIQGIVAKKVKRIQYGSYGLMIADGNGAFHSDVIGKTVFLTKEEAEAELRKLVTDTNVGSKKEREGK